MDQPILLPGLLTESGAAAYLGISPSKLRELGLPRRKLGRRRLYDRRDLENYIDNLPYDDDGVTPRNEVDEWFTSDD